MDEGVGDSCATLAVLSDHYAAPAAPLPVPSTPRQERPFQLSPGSVPAPVVAGSLPTPLQVTTAMGIQPRTGDTPNLLKDGL